MYNINTSYLRFLMACFIKIKIKSNDFLIINIKVFLSISRQELVCNSSVT